MAIIRCPIFFLPPALIEYGTDSGTGKAVPGSNPVAPTNIRRLLLTQPSCLYLFIAKQFAAAQCDLKRATVVSYFERMRLYC